MRLNAADACVNAIAPMVDKIHQDLPASLKD
jgi:hypothetical protein